VPCTSDHEASRGSAAAGFKKRVFLFITNHGGALVRKRSMISCALRWLGHCRRHPRGATLLKAPITRRDGFSTIIGPCLHQPQMFKSWLLDVRWAYIVFRAIHRFGGGSQKTESRMATPRLALEPTAPTRQQAGGEIVRDPFNAARMRPGCAEPDLLFYLKALGLPPPRRSRDLLIQSFVAVSGVRHRVMPAIAMP